MAFEFFKTIHSISRFFINWHLEQHEGEEATGGEYDPTKSYEIGEKIAFTTLDDEVGQIIAIRDGENERHGSFRVIKVRFEKRNETHEFATELKEFEVRRPGDSFLQPRLGADGLYERFADYINESVEWALARSSNFTRLDDRWLPTLMLVHFHEGHLNIADAMIDIMGQPMTPVELLTEIPLEEEASQDVKVFSLIHTLKRQQERFIQVDDAHWSLTRLVNRPTSE